MSDHAVSYENLDRLIQVEMRPKSLPTGYVPRLNAAARGAGGPIVERIARDLAALEAARIGIFTGVVIPPHLEVGEMDGPIGATVLAGALDALGHDVTIVGELVQVEALEALCAAADAPGVTVADPSVLGDDVPAYAATLDAAIAIERLSANEQGVRHSLLGTPLDSGDERIDGIFIELNRLDRLTIGIGDGGNEIGFGAIADAVRRILGPTADCRCGCEGGIVSATAVRHLLPCAISNVGAYAIAAALSLVLDRPEICPTSPLVARLIEEGMAAGLLDGATLDPTFVGDDGIPGSAIYATVELLGMIVSQRSRELADRPF